jgi:hypothetical protein
LNGRLILALAQVLLGWALLTATLQGSLPVSIWIIAAVLLI